MGSESWWCIIMLVLSTSKSVAKSVYPLSFFVQHD